MTNTVTTTGESAQIIPTFASTLGGKPATCCDARTLHTYLGNGKQFADWFKARIEQYGFEEGRDYEIASLKSEAKRGGHNRTDYRLSLSMAKELSMVENNDQGKVARRYFLECERKALEAVGQVVPASHIDTLIPSEAQTLRELVDRRCAGLSEAMQGKVRAEIWSRVQHKFRVNKYSLLARTQLADAIAYIMGMEVKAIAAPQAQPEAAPEALTNGQLQEIRRAIHFIVHGFRFGGVWTQAIYFYLRRVLGHASPYPFHTGHVPTLQVELARMLAVTDKVHELIRDIETEAARRIFRRGENVDTVVAELRLNACTAMARLDAQKLQVPAWLQQDIAAIGDKRTHYTEGLNYGNPEQPGFFEKVGA